VGGTGNGSWYRCGRKKSTVEQSLTLGITNLKKYLGSNCFGVLNWSWENGEKSSVSFYVMAFPDRPTVTLLYRWQGKDSVETHIRLVTTATQFGGRRFWFVCPLTVDGVPCNRRVGKIHLPPGGKYFGCRKCHNLTYRSCQEAHQTERFLGRLGFSADVARTFNRLRA
jgi:hypothetical protein